MNTLFSELRIVAGGLCCGAAFMAAALLIFQLI